MYIYVATRYVPVVDRDGTVPSGSPSGLVVCSGCVGLTELVEFEPE